MSALQGLEIEEKLRRNPPLRILPFIFKIFSSWVAIVLISYFAIWLPLSHSHTFSLLISLSICLLFSPDIYFFSTSISLLLSLLFFLISLFLYIYNISLTLFLYFSLYNRSLSLLSYFLYWKISTFFLYFFQ